MTIRHKHTFFRSGEGYPRKKEYLILNGNEEQTREKEREIDSYYINCHAWKKTVEQVPNGVKLIYIRGEGHNKTAIPAVFDFKRQSSVQRQL